MGQMESVHFIDRYLLFMFIELGYCIIHQLLGFDNIFSLKIIIISFSPRDTKFSLKNGKKNSFYRFVNSGKELEFTTPEKVNNAFFNIGTLYFQA